MGCAFLYVKEREGKRRKEKKRKEKSISPSVSDADSSLVRGRQGEVRQNNTSIVVFPADLKRFSRRESREISVVALARLFERSEFRSHTEQDER